MKEIHNSDELALVNSGCVCEQFIGQHLEKKAPLAVRFNLDKPSLVRAKGRLPNSTAYGYPLLPKTAPADLGDR